VSPIDLNEFYIQVRLKVEIYYCKNYGEMN